MKTSILVRLLFVLLMIAGIAVAGASFYTMFANDLPWITATERWSHEKPGPWLFGVIGLVAAAFAASELILRTHKSD